MDKLHHKFHSACKYNKQQDIKKILDKGAKIDHIDPDTGNTGLLDACARGRTRIIEFLLEQGADPHIRNKNRETPLILAIKSRNIHALEAVLKHTAIYHQRNLYDETGKNAKDWAKGHISHQFFEAIIHAETAERALYDKNRSAIKGGTPKKMHIKRKNTPPTPKKP